MRTLFAFIWRHHFILLFVILELVAGSMILRFNRHHASAFFTFTRESASSLHETVYDVSAFFSLKRENKRLAEENARLLTMGTEAYIATDTGSVIQGDTLYRHRFRFIEAEAISSSFTQRNNYVIINKGSRQAVKPRMGVITSEGVVGIVKSVSANYASAVSMLNQKAIISAELMNSGFRGYVTWDGLDFRKGILSDIPSHAPMNSGDSVVTSAASNIFPRGVMIGTVTDFEVDPATNFYQVEIAFSCDYNRLRHVTIVENLHREEVDSLLLTNQPGEE